MRGKSPALLEEPFADRNAFGATVLMSSGFFRLLELHFAGRGLDF
jgi:hypothetical protein